MMLGENVALFETESHCFNVKDKLTNKTFLESGSIHLNI